MIYRLLFFCPMNIMMIPLLMVVTQLWLLVYWKHSGHFLNDSLIKIQFIDTFCFFIRSCIIEFLTYRFYLFLIFRNILLPDFFIMFLSLSHTVFDTRSQICILCINFCTHLLIQKFTEFPIHLIFPVVRSHFLSNHQRDRHRIHVWSFIYHIHDLIFIDHMSYFCVCIIFRIIKFIFQLLDLFCKLAFSFQLSHYLRISQDIFTDIIFFSFQLISLYLIVFGISDAAQIRTKWFQNQLFSGIPYCHLDLCQLLDLLKNCRRI